MIDHETPAGTPSAASSKEPGSYVNDGSDGFIAFLKDNFEAIAVAVIMALVIKHFCVEAFKIPTGSMYPTLHGDTSAGPNRGDRILVDKFAYLITKPKRWDVIVFRYPLNRARNFIKRITGEPGEHFRISADGDLWTRHAATTTGADDLRIPQKPRHVREGFYRAVYPPLPQEDAATEAADLQLLWRVDGGAPNAWRLESAAEFVYVGGPKAVVRTVPSIVDSSTPENWGHRSGAGGC